MGEEGGKSTMGCNCFSLSLWDTFACEFNGITRMYMNAVCRERSMHMCKNVWLLTTNLRSISIWFLSTVYNAVETQDVDFQKSFFDQYLCHRASTTLWLWKSAASMVKADSGWSIYIWLLFGNKHWGKSDQHKI